MSGFKKNLFVPGKQDYIKKARTPGGSCILCAILSGDRNVANLLIARNDSIAVSANLYPYNAGHLLVFPVRHIVDPRQMNPAERSELFSMLEQSMNVLEKQYQPDGYNIGFNIGEASGASIAHLHMHIVPRYPRELGFVDVTAGAKIIIEDPAVTMERLKKAFS